MFERCMTKSNVFPNGETSWFPSKNDGFRLAIIFLQSAFTTALKSLTNCQRNGVLKLIRRMRDDWCVDGLEGMEEVEGVEAWNSPEFLQLSRRQQNVEIFKVKIVITK